MKSWIDLLSDTKNIREIYSNEDPTLSNFDVHRISLEAEGRRLLVKGDINEFPTRPPQRWVQQGFNRIHLILAFDRFRDLYIDGWRTECVVDISITRTAGTEIEVELKGEGIRITFYSGGISLDYLSSYRAETP